MESVPPSASAGARAASGQLPSCSGGTGDAHKATCARAHWCAHAEDAAAAAAVIQQTHRAKRAAADAQAWEHLAADAAETAAAYALIAEHADILRADARTPPQRAGDHHTGTSAGRSDRVRAAQP